MVEGKFSLPTSHTIQQISFLSTLFPNYFPSPLHPLVPSHPVHDLVYKADRYVILCCECLGRSRLVALMVIIDDAHSIDLGLGEFSRGIFRVDYARVAISPVTLIVHEAKATSKIFIRTSLHAA